MKILPGVGWFWDSFAPDKVPVERLEEPATDAQMIIDRVRC